MADFMLTPTFKQSLQKEMATHSNILAWKISWTEEPGGLQPTPIFLPGRFHGQRSLAGYSPWGHKEADATEHTRTFKQQLANKLYIRDTGGIG